MEEEIKSVPLSKYIVLKKTSQGLPKSHWTYMALINRSITKEHWWTVDSDMAFKFTSKRVADAKAKSLKYGPCIVIKASDFNKYVGREFYKIKLRGYRLKQELMVKENQIDSDGNAVSDELDSTYLE